MTSRGVSLAEVAERGAVSVATASRVLNPDSTYPVSDVTRERVFAAARALNYTPNRNARALRARHGHTLGVVVHDIRDPYFGHCLRGVTEEASKAGYLTIICNSDRRARVELDYVQMLIEQRIAGVVFAGGELIEPGYRQELARLVQTMRAYGGEVVALAPRTEGWLAELPDNRGGSQKAVLHLLELGHRQIGFINGPENLLTSTDRRAGYADALEQAGVPVNPALVVDGDFSLEGGMVATLRLIRSGETFTAIFAANDEMAAGALHALRQENIAVPQAVSLVGFGDLAAVSWLQPPLTTVAMPMHELATAATARLLAVIEGSARSVNTVHVHPTELVVRASTAPPPSAGTPSAVGEANY